MIVTWILFWYIPGVIIFAGASLFSFKMAERGITIGDILMFLISGLLGWGNLIILVLFLCEKYGPKLDNVVIKPWKKRNDEWKGF